MQETSAAEPRQYTLVDLERARDRVAAAERRIDNDRRSNPNVEHAGWSWRSSNCPIFELQLRLRGLLEARSSSPDIPDQTLPERIKCKLGCPSRAISGADKLALRGVTCVRDRFFFLRLSIGAARPTKGEIQPTASSGNVRTVKISSSGSRKDCSWTSNRSEFLNWNHASAPILRGKFCSEAPLTSAAKLCLSKASLGNHHG